MMETSISLEVPLPATPARVFQALTDPRGLERWAWGGIGHDARAQVDLRVGGRYEVSVALNPEHGSPDTRWGMRGVYIEIDPPRRLVYTLHWDAPVGYNETGDALDEVVIIELTGRGAQTDLHYLHLGVPTPEAAAEHRKAIAETFELLGTHLRPA